MPTQIEILQEITNRINESLNQWTIPWRKPWKDDQNCGAAANVVSKRAYLGSDEMRDASPLQAAQNVGRQQSTMVCR